MDKALERFAAELRRQVREVLGDGQLRTRVETKADGSLITDADRLLQARIGDWLADQYPGAALLAEEQSRERNQALIDAAPSQLWVLDPLDGTTNLASGIPYTAVSLALVENGEVVQGVVYDPDRDEIFCARRGAGAYCNGERLTPPETGRSLGDCVALVDFKRLDSRLATALASRHPFRSQRNFGSVALDWCWLAVGRGQLYLHGRANLWDYVAGWLIAGEAGIASQTLEGEDVFHFSLAGRSAVAAANPSLLADWRDWIREAL